MTRVADASKDQELTRILDSLNPILDSLKEDLDAELSAVEKSLSEAIAANNAKLDKIYEVLMGGVDYIPTGKKPTDKDPLVYRLAFLENANASNHEEAVNMIKTLTEDNAQLRDRIISLEKYNLDKERAELQQKTKEAEEALRKVQQKNKEEVEEAVTVAKKDQKFAQYESGIKYAMFAVLGALVSGAVALVSFVIRQYFSTPTP